jgi:hypothetical protein
MSTEDIYESSKKLRGVVGDKERDSECYNIYVSLMVELCDMTKEKLSLLDSNIQKSYKVMSYHERENIRKVVLKQLAADDLEKKVKGLDDILALFTKIMRYGMGQ